MALCSLSTGSTLTPRRRAASITSAPAITRISLFASAIVLPASIAASTASRRGGPRGGEQHHVHVGMGGDRHEAVAAGACGRRGATVPRALSSRSSDCSAASEAMATAAGANRDDLLGEARRVLAGRERDDAQAIGMRLHHRQRALADRAGRSEDGDAVHQDCRYRTNR